MQGAAVEEEGMGKRYIREQWTECGEKYAEVDLFWVSEAEHKAGPRRKKELASSLAQQNRNDWHARRYLPQLINCNFDARGLHVSLTYDGPFLPQSEEQAARDLENWAEAAARSLAAALGAVGDAVAQDSLVFRKVRAALGALDHRHGRARVLLCAAAHDRAVFITGAAAACKDDGDIDHHGKQHPKKNS